ncbi:MAG: hypothetical protein H7263_02530, partial [Candidatus Sericytochromatia bacterium]|nr:hypothetical protein [Candidatus Sericytochromatia bacterium]
VSTNKAVFGLPGNPVASLICFYKYILPFLDKSMSINEKTSHVYLAQDIKIKKDITIFLPVIIKNENSKDLATHIKNNGSGDYNSLVGTDGFIEITSKDEIILKGKSVPFYSW